MIRGILFQVHLWTGLVLGIVLVLLGLSGSALVYHDELMAWSANPLPQASTSGSFLSADQLIERGKAAVGGKADSVTLVLPKSAGEAASVFMRKIEGGDRAGKRGGHGGKYGMMQGAKAGAGEHKRTAGPGGGEGRRAYTYVYLDPVSGAVLDIRPTTLNPVFAFLHDFHGNFLMGRDGRSAVGWFGIAMVALGLSGIVLWWPKRGTWKNAFGVRKNAKGYLLHRDLHGAAGIWLWVVFIIVSFSGAVISFPDTVRTISQAHPVSFDPRRGPEIAPLDGVTPLSADGVIAVVQSAVPDAKIASIAVPSRDSEAYRVMLGTMEDGPVSAAYVDPYRKTIAGWRNDPQGPAGERFVAWQRPLHAGMGWGPLWRALVFVSGFLPLLFVITGTVMWLKKRKGRAARA